MAAEDTILELHLDRQLATQAEISFKAGIKEVVEWIEGQQRELYSKAQSTTFAGFNISKNSWQAKLKEWEIPQDVEVAKAEGTTYSSEEAKC